MPFEAPIGRGDTEDEVKDDDDELKDDEDDASLPLPPPSAQRPDRAVVPAPTGSIHAYSTRGQNADDDDDEDEGVASLDRTASTSMACDEEAPLSLWLLSEADEEEEDEEEEDEKGLAAAAAAAAAAAGTVSKESTI